MLQLKNIQYINDTRGQLNLASNNEGSIDCSHLLALPGLIDPHVHFRVPGASYKEDWTTASKAAIAGGITTVFDMPNNTPSTTTEEAIQSKHKLIVDQLSESGIPLRYKLYLGANPKLGEDFTDALKNCFCLKVYLSSNAQDLLIEEDETLEMLFALCSRYKILMAFHSEDPLVLQALQRQESFRKSSYSMQRHRQAAITTTQKLIYLCGKYHTPIIILHVSTKEEVFLIGESKNKGKLVYAETSPHHLFLNESLYQEIGSLAAMNPPLRTSVDNDVLLDAIKQGIIDTIGTDHAPHSIEEKMNPLSPMPGVPGLESHLPLLLNAVNKQQLSIEDVIRITRKNIEHLYDIPGNDDLVFVDLQEERTFQANYTNTKCKWSPYEGMRLKGWPVYTLIKDKLYTCEVPPRCLT